jgi:hypothetical protein
MYITRYANQSFANLVGHKYQMHPRLVSHANLLLVVIYLRDSVHVENTSGTKFVPLDTVYRGG